MVTDGTAVVEKTDHLSEVLHQIWHFHGIHLPVIDVLYKKNNAGKHEDEIFHNETIHEVTANEEWNIDNNTQITREKSLNDSEGHDLELSEKIESFINKIQMVVRIFCRSLVKNDVLQKNCLAEFNREFNLIMDTRTRWNSSLKMLSRFLKIHTAVEKTLQDLDHGSKCLDENKVNLTKYLKEL